MEQGGRHERSQQPVGSELDSDVDYHAQWRAFALRRNTALFLLYTWIPVTILLFELSRNGWHQPVLCLCLIFLWLVAALGAVWWAGEFRCPRCRRRYGALGNKKGDVNITRGIFDKVCANCKLRKFEHVR